MMVFSSRINGVATAALLCLLSACNTLPDRQADLDTAKQVIPAAWTNARPAADVATSQVGTTDWWTAVNDPYLQQLVQQALAQNLSLTVAARRVDQARRQADQTASEQWPQAQGQVGSTSSKPLDGGTTTRRASASVSVSWELDLWQRLAAQTQAAEWNTQAVEQDHQALRLSLAASVVRQYWQWGYAQQRVQVAQQNLVLARQTARLIELQYQAGAISGLARAQAQQSLAAQEASLAQWRASQEESRQTLALLLGQAPQAVALPDRGVLPVGLPPAFTPGLPASVLACRPDVRASQARLQQAWSQASATARQWYPALTLTGSVSGSSVALSDVLKDPLGAVSSTLTMPFLQWQERARQVDIADADADIARLNFQQTLFTALSEVDKNLVLQEQLKAQLNAQQRRLNEALTVERLTKARFDAGAEPLRVWLDAQQDARQSELDHAQVALQAWTQWANAMLALGQGAC
jgi:NodT family efflux transporter outer membrane factor (OMF) lipoprotein